MVREISVAVIISKNMDDSIHSDCIITNVVPSEECIADGLSKRPKIKIDEDFSLTLISGDGHWIANSPL